MNKDHKISQINRRKFMKQSAKIAAAGILINRLPASTRKQVSHEGEIKVALVGCGGRGTGAAAQAILADENVRLVAMADVFEDQAQSCYKNLIERFGDSDKVKASPETTFIGFDGYKKAIDMADVVILTTPPGFRPLHFEYAVDNNKQIFMEKPVATDVAGIKKVLEAGKKHNLMVIAPAHHRRIQAGILSWGQDMDHEHNPFQCNLGYQVSLSGKGEWNKKGDYVGKKALEKMKEDIKAGHKPYKLQLVGLELGGKPIEEYAPDFWLISENGSEPVGFITSPWYHPEKGKNIAMGYVPFDGTLNANGFPRGKVGSKFKVHLPEKYSDKIGEPVDAVVVDVPFTESYNANTREVVNK